MVAGVAAIAPQSRARLDMPATVVITGASSGIGLELCKQLTARGDVVYATCRNSNADLEAVGVTGGVVAGIDVTSAECAAKLRAALKDVSIDVLINNAGSMGSTKPRIGSSDEGGRAALA